jgi:hypothetical protein
MSERMNELFVNLGASEKAAVESAAGAEAIVDCVFRAILERRLPPAAKLSENGANPRDRAAKAIRRPSSG